MRSTPKVTKGKKVKAPGLREIAGNKTIICHLANVHQNNYEEWRDSMPDEYYFALVEELSSEKMQKILTRLM